LLTIRKSNVTDCYSFGGEEGGGFLKGIGNNPLTIIECLFMNVAQYGYNDDAGGVISFFSYLILINFFFFIQVEFSAYMEDQLK
jgi:hypothetical protein